MTVPLGRLPTDPQPGSNLKGDAAGAAWTYLLDSLELGTVLCLGEPSRAARATLDRIATRIIVAEVDVPGRELGDSISVDGLANVAESSIDLVYVTSSSRAALDTAAVIPLLAPLLSSRGQLYVEDRRSGRLAKTLADAGLKRVGSFWLTPSRGEMRSAVPMNDQPIRDLFVYGGIAVPSLPRPLRRVEHWFPVLASRNRVGLLAGHSNGESSSVVRIPAYLQSMAAAEGVDLSAHRLGLSARGRYSSRKVIFYLFAPQARRPDLIIKATRDPAHNSRLANEERVLRHLDEFEVIGPGSAPEILFSGEHGGLRFVAETAVEGALLTSRAHGIGGAAAYTLLTELSVASARRDAEAQSVIVSLLEGIGAAVERLYTLEPSDRDRLRRATGILIDHAHRLPVVLMHGDAATWNARLRPDGRAAFMDWEAAELQGMPLWDILYFARSHILWGARLRERARRPSAMVRALHADARLLEAIMVYCQRLDIPADLIAPLFSLCWAHRAIREVTRLKAGHLDKGHYLGLLRESLDAENATWDGSSRTKDLSAL